MQLQCLLLNGIAKRSFDTPFCLDMKHKQANN